MARTRTIALLPLWIAILAGAVLLALMLKVQPVVAPGNIQQLTTVTARSPEPGQASSEPAQREVGRAQTISPFSAPPAAQQQLSPQAPAAPGSAQCATASSRGIACTVP